MANNSSSSHPQLSNSASSQTASPPLLKALQKSMTALLNHVRYLEHGLKMVLPADLHEEFESDKILFGINSESEQDEPEAPASSSASLANISSSSPSAPSNASDDLPLIGHVKRSKLGP